MPHVPLVWVAIVEHLFGMSPKFALRLWPCMIITPTVLWQLSQVDALPTSKDQWAARVRRLSELLPPAMMLRASLKLSPEGKRRDPLCVQFEESVLLALDHQGQWNWR